MPTYRQHLIPGKLNPQSQKHYDRLLSVSNRESLERFSWFSVWLYEEYIYLANVVKKCSNDNAVLAYVAI